jgi:hypothetical protein
VVVPTGSALNGGQVAFYLAAATAIPILLLAYLVQIAAIARRISGSQAGREVTAAPPSPPLPVSVPRQVRVGAVLPVLVVAAGMPVAAELSSFLALANNHGSQAISVITWVGLAVALIAVLSPVVVALALVYRSQLPYFAEWRRLLGLRGPRRHSASDATDEDSPSTARGTDEPPTRSNGDSG